MEQRTEDWFAARIGRITSTCAKTVIKGTARGKTSLMGELVAEIATAKEKQVPQTFWMRHGTVTEPKAIAMYQMMIGAPVASGGFCVHPEHDLVADSPDGLIGITEGLVEVKCPEAKTHGTYLVDNCIPADYIQQVDWHLYVTGRSWCDFVSFNEDFPPSLQMLIIRRERDQDAMVAIDTKVQNFLNDYESALRRLGLSL